VALLVRLLRLWGRFDLDHRQVRRRMIVVACLGWLPLLVLHCSRWVLGTTSCGGPS